MLKNLFLLLLSTPLALNANDTKSVLTPVQEHVTMQCGTEPPFRNDFWNNHREGIYVCIISGEPLFSSKDKFDSGTGWPSFYQSLPNAIGTKADRKLFAVRTEVHCRRCGSHLGHVFADGPAPTGKRHCLNGVSLVFKAA